MNLTSQDTQFHTLTVPGLTTPIHASEENADQTVPSTTFQSPAQPQKHALKTNSHGTENLKTNAVTPSLVKNANVATPKNLNAQKLSTMSSVTSVNPRFQLKSFLLEEKRTVAALKNISVSIWSAQAFKLQLVETANKSFPLLTTVAAVI
jgi:hypothetical protein